MKHSPEIICKNIKKERLKKGWSQAKLGERLHVIGKQISNYENEDPNKNTLPPLLTLLNMCDLFECDLGYLVGEDGYSQKTKKLSITANETGFTEKSLQQIRTVMGFPNTSKSFVFEEESDEYRRINNNFVSSPRFITLIEELKKLDDIYRERSSFITNYNNKKSALKSQLDKMEPIKAEFINKQTPPIVIESFSPEEEKIWESLNDKEFSLIHQLDELDTDYYYNLGNFDHDMKCQRYIIQETISFIINDLYPTDNL